MMKKRRIFWSAQIIFFLFLAIWPPLQGKEEDDNDNKVVMMKKLIGSRPPKCEGSCGKCKPCKAIQVPTNSDRLGLLYANYEPEGWKCKCGSAFFNP